MDQLDSSSDAATAVDIDFVAISPASAPYFAPLSMAITGSDCDNMVTDTQM
jgi:hypothetical protein